MKKQNLKNTRGITLIALVVTIVVLLILAGVSISMLTGENGIITQAQDAKDQNKKGEVEEKVRLAVMSAKTVGKGKIDFDELNSELDKIGYEGEDVTELPKEVTINGVKVTIKADGNTDIKQEDDEDETGIVADSLGIAPKINEEEMKPVKYDDTTGEWVEANPSVAGDWFDYSAKQWANVETENGYFVYIPRYAYKITSGYHQRLNTAGTIEIVFLNGDNTLKTTTDSQGNAVSQSDLVTADQVNSSVENEGINATTKYIIHPAFEAFGDVEGLWVAKYEMSMEETTDEGTSWTHKETSDSTIGDILTSTDTTKRMVSKPGVSSWRNIRVTNIFKNSYDMDRTLDSHMMKNTEWGAVAYLTVSQYGKGATSEVEKNESSSFYTGYGANAKLSTGAASTTGNMYGVFDMSGGAYEYVAAYLDDECTQKTETTTGSRYDYNKNLIEEENSKYKDIYQIKTNEDGTTSNAGKDCYTANNLKVGDALWEVSSDIGSNYGWYRNYASFVCGDLSCYPVFSRGGTNGYTGANPGVFYAYKYSGDASGSDSFRVVCVVE